MTKTQDMTPAQRAWEYLITYHDEDSAGELLASIPEWERKEYEARLRNNGYPVNVANVLIEYLVSYEPKCWG